MMEFINNIMFWIIAFFVAIVLFLLLFVVLILIKMKTNAMTELKAFFKKAPVSLFFEDGKFLEMKVGKPDTGLIKDEAYGCFIRNEKCSYLGKTTRNIYDVYDTGFAPGINIKAAQVSQELKTLLNDEEAYLQIGKAMSNGTLKDESLDCIRGNINVSSLKNLYDCIEPHNINANIEKNVAKQVRSIGKSSNGQYLLMFIVVFGAMVGGYILLKMFNTG